MKLITTVIKAVLVAYLVIFAVINMQQVELTFFFEMQPFAMPMFLFVILVVFIGFVVGVLMMTGEKISASRQIKKLEKQLSAATEEINRLKNIPLTENPVTEPASQVALPEQTESQTGAIKDALR